MAAPMVQTKLNRNQFRSMRRTVQKAPGFIKKNVVKRWNNSALVFRRLMQDRHLSGGTTKDRLARRSSNLYNALRHEVRLSSFLIQISVWFIDVVKDYAPTHEFGDTSKNIPPRMNLRSKWKKFRPKFERDVREAMEKGLEDAR